MHGKINILIQKKVSCKKAIKYVFCMFYVLHYDHYDLLNVRNIAELQDPFMDIMKGKSNYELKSL